MRTPFAASCLGLTLLASHAPTLHATQPRSASVTTVASDIPAGTGGLEVGPDGMIYHSDFGATLSRGPLGTRVFQVTPTGQVSLFAEGLRGASGNAMAPDGTFYQSNIGGNSISTIGRDGTVLPYAQGLKNPVGITIHPGGELSVASCGDNTIRRIDRSGVVSTLSADSLLRCPNGITLASDGNLYVSNFGNGDVVRISPAGDATRVATLPGGNNGHLFFGHGVLYVVARKAHQIYVVTLSGDVTLLAGSGARGHRDGPALEATFSLPNDGALSPDGRTLYVNEVAPVVEGDQILAPTTIRAIHLP